MNETPLVEPNHKAQPQAAEQATREYFTWPMLAGVEPGEAHESQEQPNKGHRQPARGRRAQTTVRDEGGKAKHGRKRRQVSARKAGQLDRARHAHEVRTRPRLFNQLLENEIQAAAAQGSTGCDYRRPTRTEQK
jgi:hypothetical protein